MTKHYICCHKDYNISAKRVSTRIKPSLLLLHGHVTSPSSHPQGLVNKMEDFKQKWLSEIFFNVKCITKLIMQWMDYHVNSFIKDLRLIASEMIEFMRRIAMKSKLYILKFLGNIWVCVYEWACGCVQTGICTNVCSCLWTKYCFSANHSYSHGIQYFHVSLVQYILGIVLLMCPHSHSCFYMYKLLGNTVKTLLTNKHSEKEGKEETVLSIKANFTAKCSTQRLKCTLVYYW